MGLHLHTLPGRFSCCNLSRTCPAKYYPSFNIPTENEELQQPTENYPDYFRWILEGLSLWRKTDITRRMVLNASRNGTFRLVILNGKAYVQKYRRSFQSRSMFTLWGSYSCYRGTLENCPIWI